MKNIIEIRKVWGPYCLYFPLDDHYEMIEQLLAITFGWASPVDVE